MKRITLFTIAVIIILCVYISVINYSNSIHLNYYYSQLLEAQTNAGLTDMGSYFYKEVSLGIYSIIVLLLGFLAGSGIISIFLSTQNEKVKEYKKELEKTSLYSQNSTSRVAVLEAKIKTLEKAFNTVADERTKLEIQIKDLNNELDNINKNN